MPLNTEVGYNNVVIKGTVELGVKGERGLQGFKGDQGIQGPPVPVARGLGDDPDLAVSQKLLTDSIADMELGNSEAVREATRQAGLAGDSAVIATDQAGIAASRAVEAEQSAQAAAQSATQAEETLDDKLNKPPSDGVLYGVRNGVFVPIMAGSTAHI